jgi:excisionase family DNA binding protein
MNAYGSKQVALDDIRALATIDVDTLALVLGIGRNAAYDAVKNGDVPSWKIGGRILIPVPALLRKLGEV